MILYLHYVSHYWSGMFQITLASWIVLEQRDCSIIVQRVQNLWGETFRYQKAYISLSCIRNIISSAYSENWGMSPDWENCFPKVDGAGILVLFDRFAWESDHSFTEEYFDSFLVGVNFERIIWCTVEFFIKPLHQLKLVVSVKNVSVPSKNGFVKSSLKMWEKHRKMPVFRLKSRH